MRRTASRRAGALLAVLATLSAGGPARAQEPPNPPVSPEQPAQSPPEKPEQPAQGRRPRIEYDRGVDVSITSKDPATEIYLAHGDVPIGEMPDPYERIGLTPITLKLAAGTYSIETASPTQSTGHQRFVVEQGKPLAIEVRPGDASVKTVGSVVVGLGVVSIVLGVIAILSFSPNDSNYNRFGIGIPLIAGGGAGCGIGVGMVALGSTDFRVQPQAGPAKGAARVLLPTLTWKF